ncbi:MAG: peptidoglycan-binding protein, partial [Clostridia bacterium]|nr:peptidoglycan-binding protein [Clostridia bacterium]
IPEYDPIPSGDQGEHVYYMQDQLAKLGYLTEEYDGFYGEATKESVKAFQIANGLEATGEVDPITHAMLYYEKVIRADGTTAGTAAEPTAAPTADPAENAEAVE